MSSFLEDESFNLRHRASRVSQGERNITGSEIDNLFLTEQMSPQVKRDTFELRRGTVESSQHQNFDTDR